MTDSQVAEETFMVLKNDMLASREIPDLFPDVEIETICNGFRNEWKQLAIMDIMEIFHWQCLPTDENCFIFLKWFRSLPNFLCKKIANLMNEFNV